MRNLNAMTWEAYGQCLTITTKQIVQWCGIKPRTARRWISDPAAIPEPSRRLITLCALGGVLPLDWRQRGYRFWGDILHTGNGHHFNAAHLEHYEMAYSDARAKDIHIERLKSDINRHKQFIKYLMSVTTVANVIEFDKSRARPSLTDGHGNNSLFQKPDDHA